MPRWPKIAERRGEGQRIRVSSLVLCGRIYIDWNWASLPVTGGIHRSEAGSDSCAGGAPMIHSTTSRIILSLAMLCLALPVAARQDKKEPPTAEEKKAAQDEKRANEEAGKKAVAEFESQVKDCKTIPEKA